MSSSHYGTFASAPSASHTRSSQLNLATGPVAPFSDSIAFTLTQPSLRPRSTQDPPLLLGTSRRPFVPPSSSIRGPTTASDNPSDAAPPTVVSDWAVDWSAESEVDPSLLTQKEEDQRYKKRHDVLHRIQSLGKNSKATEPEKTDTDLTQTDDTCPAPTVASVSSKLSGAATKAKQTVGTFVTNRMQSHRNSEVTKNIRHLYQRPMEVSVAAMNACVDQHFDTTLGSNGVGKKGESDYEKSTGQGTAIIETESEDIEVQKDLERKRMCTNAQLAVSAHFDAMVCGHSHMEEMIKDEGQRKQLDGSHRMLVSTPLETSPGEGPNSALRPSRHIMYYEPPDDGSRYSTMYVIPPTQRSTPGAGAPEFPDEIEGDPEKHELKPYV